MGVLAACAEPPPPRPARTVAVEPPPAIPIPLPRRRAVPLPARKPTPPPANEAAGALPSDAAMAMASPEPATPSSEPATPSIEPAAPGPQPAAPTPRASELIGLDQPAATNLLGSATERSSAPPATIWRYRNATCELDLFFYLDLRSGKMRTLHYAFKGGAADPAEREDCLRSFVVARRS
jgi:hypothetical protein